jgi:hypothetical protein
MELTVLGARDRKLTKTLKLAATFFAKKLLHSQLSRHITLRITIRDSLDAGAYCDFVPTSNPPRIFLIEILRTKRKIDMFTALAHEMVHLKQYATGEMKDKKCKTKYVRIWRGEIYEDDVSYWDHPWEFEAYGLQDSLVAKFLIEHNQFKNLRQSQKDWFVQRKKNSEA